MLLDIESWIGGLGIGLVILGIVLLIVYVWVIIDIVKNAGLSPIMKLVWIAAVIFFPVIGVLLYLFIGKNSTGTRSSRY